MIAAQIIHELPKLVELAEQNEDVALCDAMALEGAQMLDQMEK